jgi:cytochrome c
MKLIKYLLLISLAGATATALAQQGDAKRGQKVFEVCGACHAANGASNEVGPSLRGVFGRKAGSLDDFRYSPAMKRSGITWTAQSLEAFITEPQKMVPANRMPYDGLPNARDRADLIAWMQQAFKQ